LNFQGKIFKFERLTSEMNNDFNTIIDFLERFGPEVTGRELPEPINDETPRLQRFIEGDCKDPEREEICSMLRLHPAWLRWIADRVRLARSPSGGAH
jgi:hypothetical protein